MSADTKTSLLLQAIAGGVEDALAEAIGERPGIVLMVFPMGRPGVANYISNCDRSDMQTAIRELLKRWDEGMPDIPAHHKN